MNWILYLCFFVPVSIMGQSYPEMVDDYLQAGDYDGAEQILLDEIKNNKDAELMNKLGEVYGVQGQWDKAIDIYRDLTLSYPRNAEYYFRYGGVLAKKAQNSNIFTGLSLLGKIKSSFRKAIRLDPDHLGAHWALVDLYVSLPFIVGGSMSQAYRYATDLKKISELDGHLALGYVFEYDDKAAEAKSNYLKALQLLTQEQLVERNQLHYQIGKICSEYSLELDKGIYHLNEYIDRYTVLDGVPLEWAYYRLAMIYRQKSEKDKALKWINKSLDLNPAMEQAVGEKKTIEQL